VKGKRKKTGEEEKLHQKKGYKRNLGKRGRPGKERSKIAQTLKSYTKNRKGRHNKGQQEKLSVGRGRSKSSWATRQT